MSERGEMRDFSREKVVLALAVPSLILFVFLFLVTTNTTIVSGVEAKGVGVYWDRGCTDKVSSINWGTLEPGSTKSIASYIRNEGNEPMRLILSTSNWNPLQASEYLSLGWNYTYWRLLDPGEVLQITLTLSVFPHIEGISSFSFDILVTGSDSLLGDVNEDGTVDSLDVKLVKLTLSGWIVEPRADVNGDGSFNNLDVKLVRLAVSAPK